MNAPEKVALSACQVSAGIGKCSILHRITLPLAAGRWTSIVGPNGAGKSTLLKVLAGLLPHTGQVSLQGQPLARLPGRLRAQRLAWLGQNEAGTDDLTAWDVVMLGRLPHQPWLAAQRDLFVDDRSIFVDDPGRVISGAWIPHGPRKSF